MGKPINSAGKKVSKVEQLSLEIERLRGAVQINQHLLQQASKSLPAMKADLDEFISRQRDIQYRLLAFESLANVSTEDLAAEVTKLQLLDFEDLNNKDDIAKGLIPHPTGVVDENAVVVITTKTPLEEDDAGILRSKLEIRQLPEGDAVKDALLGAKVSDNVEFDLNGVKHVAVVLDIKAFKEENNEQ